MLMGLPWPWPCPGSHTSRQPLHQQDVWLKCCSVLGISVLRWLDGRKREVVTIYEIIKDEDSGDVLWAVPDYQFE